MRRRLLFLFLLLPSIGVAQLAGPYGVEHTAYLHFLDTDGTDLTGEVDAGTEVTLSCDGAAGATATNDFGADTNTSGYYPLTLTAAEMQCGNLNIQVAASVAQSFQVETYGDAMAAHTQLGWRNDTAAGQATEFFDGSVTLFGTCSAGTTTSCDDTALDQADASQLEDRIACYDDSWCGLVTTFDPANDRITHTKTAPSTRNGKAYIIFPATAQ